MKTRSYWATQFAVLGFFAIALPVLGLFFITETDEPGRGVILIFCGILFLGTLAWLFRSYRRMTATQREIYAWAITQQHAAGVADNITMEIAGRAQVGTLQPDELQWLRDLNPANPYPADTQPTHPRV